MKTEFEARILDIDIGSIIKTLVRLGAKKVSDNLMKRFVYDVIPRRKDSWIRLRFDGNKTTLTVKEMHSDKIDGTRENEIMVDDFDKTNLLLEKLGYFNKGYQENRRIRYELDGVEIDLDFWPMIPPYMEIEGKSVAEVEAVIRQLGFSPSQATSIGVLDVFKKYGIDLESIKELKF